MLKSTLLFLIVSSRNLKLLKNNIKVVRIHYPDVEIPGPNTMDQDMVCLDEILLKAVCCHVAGEDIWHIKFDPVNIVRAAINMQLCFERFKD